MSNPIATRHAIRVLVTDYIMPVVMSALAEDDMADLRFAWQATSLAGMSSESIRELCRRLSIQLKLNPDAITDEVMSRLDAEYKVSSEPHELIVFVKRVAKERFYRAVAEARSRGVLFTHFKSGASGQSQTQLHKEQTREEWAAHALLTSESYRRQVRGTVPLRFSDTPDVHNEAEIIAAFSLADAHCQDCHESRKMSCLLIGDRLIDVCCEVVVNHKNLAR